MKKIMFNDRYGLTQAVIDGRKTMTRRVITHKMAIYSLNEQEFMQQLCLDKRFIKKYSRYQIGEVVAVAQSYKNVAEQSLKSGFVGDNIDYQIHFKNHKGWDNKMFVKADLMPHRIRITDIKVERLQDCSDDDCLKEGIFASNAFEIGYGEEEAYVFSGTKEAFSTPREAFAALIDKVSGKGTWESNPWVFVYTFELVKGGEK